MIDIENTQDREALVAYARKEFGIKVHPSALIETVRKRVMALKRERDENEEALRQGPVTHAPGEIVDKDVKEELANRPPAPTKKDDSDMVTIMIPKAKGETQPVFVGVNGRGFTIPRGVKVPVPRSVLGVLENAIESNFDENGDPTGDSPAVNYQVFM